MQATPRYVHCRATSLLSLRLFNLVVFSLRRTISQLRKNFGRNESLTFGPVHHHTNVTPHTVRNGYFSKFRGCRGGSSNSQKHYFEVIRAYWRCLPGSRQDLSTSTFGFRRLASIGMDLMFECHSYCCRDFSKPVGKLRRSYVVPRPAR